MHHRQLVFGASATDPAVVSIAALLLLGMVALGCAAPLARALRIDPVHALRAE